MPGVSLELVGAVVAALWGAETLGASWGWADWLTLMLVGTGRVLLIVGMSCYAMGKGQSRWFGLVGLLGLVGVVALAFLRDRDARRKSGRCLGCGYDLTGLSGGICPECGGGILRAGGVRGDDETSRMQRKGCTLPLQPHPAQRAE